MVTFCHTTFCLVDISFSDTPINDTWSGGHFVCESDPHLNQKTFKQKSEKHFFSLRDIQATISSSHLVLLTDNAIGAIQRAPKERDIPSLGLGLG